MKNFRIILLGLAIIIGLGACTFSFQGTVDRNGITITAKPTDWLTYQNDKYGYSFDYPRDAKITEMDKNAFNITPEENKSGITTDSLLAQYTGKLCIRTEVEEGYITVAAAANNKPNGDTIALCMRTGVGTCSPDSMKNGGIQTNYDKDVTIGGKKYTAHGTGSNCPGDNPVYTESLRVKLDDGTNIEFGGSAASKDGYAAVKNKLVQMVESYKKK